MHVKITHLGTYDTFRDRWVTQGQNGHVGTVKT